MSRVKRKIQTREATGNTRFVLLHYCYLMARNEKDGLY